MIKENKSTTIMNVVNNIYSAKDEGLLGFCVREEMENDQENHEKVGNYIVYLFKKYPEQAQLLEEMLIAICGWGIESLRKIMEEQREYYESL